MKKRYTYYLLLLLLFTACKSAETKLKTEDTQQALAELETILNQKKYRIDIHTIMPFNTMATTQVLNALLVPRTGNSANRIDVSGDGNFIEIQDSIASSYLPFFGEIQMSTSIIGGTDSAIQFKSLFEDYSVEPYKNEDAFVVKFKANQENQNMESFNVRMIVFLNKGADITLLSSHRNFIRYQGDLRVLETLEE